MYEENIRATADQHLAAGCCNQLKTQTQDDGEPLQEFSTVIEQVTHRAFPALHKDRVGKGSGKTFSNGTRDLGAKQELSLGSNRTLSETHRQTPELDIIKLTAGSSIQLRKMSDRISWRSQSPPKQKKKWLYTSRLFGMNSLKEGPM
jgi:hypothetical protein